MRDAKNGLLIRPGTNDTHELSRDFSRLYGEALEYAKPGDCVFDLGAHIGGFSVRAARAGFTVVAVEPNPSNVQLLEWNVAGLDVTIYDAAVASSKGYHQFVFNSSAPASGRLLKFRRTVRNATLVTVPTLDIDKLIEDYQPSVIKMDIEGAEWDVLPKCWSSVRAMVVEIHPWNRSDDEWFRLFFEMDELGWNANRISRPSIFGKEVLWTRGERDE